MKRRHVLTALLGAGLLSAAPALAQNPKSTFTIARTAQWGAQNYNPFSPSHLPPTLSAIYEPLFFINTLTGKVTDELGTKYAWSNGNKTLTVTTRDGVKWSDGQAFTPADVAFTFNYLKQYSALDTSALWKNGLASVKASGANSVVFTFSTVNTPILQYIAGTIIVPQHIWANVKDPLTETNANPVGTGPFVTDSFSQQALRLLKNTNYWMKGQPYVDAVVWTSNASNDAAQLQLLTNQADYSYDAVADPKGGYADKGPNFTYWWPVNSNNYLYMNTTKAPFSDVNFRRAVAMAINTKDAAVKAYAGVVNGSLENGLIPAQSSVWAPNNATTNVPYDPKAADAALTKAGYKLSGGRRLGKDGKPLANIRIVVGAGWTDFISMAQVVVQNLKALGITATIDQQQPSSYIASLQTGTYDTGVSWGWGTGSTPYYLFYASFDPDNSAAAGKTASSNLTRYTNPAVTKALDTFRGSSDMAVQKKAMATIVSTVQQDAPWVPLTQKINFNLFNTSRFTGFPSAQNPYMDNDDASISGRMLLLNVKPK